MGIVGDILGSTRQLTRRDQIAIEGSPPFEWDNPQILANATWSLNLENDGITYGTQIQKYLPLDFVEVLNDQVEDLNLVINDTLTYRVLGNSVRTVTGRRITAVKLVNQSANTIAAAAFKVIVERTPLSSDEATRRSARSRAR